MSDKTFIRTLSMQYQSLDSLYRISRGRISSEEATALRALLTVGFEIAGSTSIPEYALRLAPSPPTIDLPDTLDFAGIGLIVPPLILAFGKRGCRLFLEFFTKQLKNENTRRAYAISIRDFIEWCEKNGIKSLAAIQEGEIAAYIAHVRVKNKKNTAGQRLAAIRKLYSWLSYNNAAPNKAWPVKIR